MVAAISSTRWRHLPCFAHSLNLVVQNSIKSDPELSAVQTKCKNVVSHFHRSVKSTEKLAEIQRQLSLPEHKLIQDVSTRWNSTYIMLERFYEQFEAITTTLCLVNQNDLCLKAEEKDTISRALQLLKPYLEATENISGQTYVSISMIVPLTKILQQHCSSLYRANPSSVLAGSLNSELNNRFTSIETHLVSTLIDPCFKKISFVDKTALSHTINRITQELQTVVLEPTISSSDQDSRSADMEEVSTESIWNSFDQKAKESQVHQTSTVEATIEVRRYFEEAVISRNKDPLEWWKENSCRFPLLKVLARRYLCIPGSSVPSERLFSQAGVLVSERRNRISPKNVDLILFLNQNL